MSEGARATAGKVRTVADGVVEVFLPLPSKPSIINVFLLDCGGGEWALVDTGVALPESREAFATALHTLDIDPRAIRHVLGTHHHPDHFGASKALDQDGEKRFYLHPLERKSLQESLAGPSDAMIVHGRRHGMPIPPDQTSTPAAAEIWAGTFAPTMQIDHALEDGQVLELGHRRLQVVWTPGHTAGHCCFLDLDDKSFFVGDHLLPKITPHVGVFATGPRNPLGDFLASQAKVAALDVGIVCPAHGRTFSTHRHRAQQIIDHHEHRLREILDAIKARPRSAYQVAQRVFAWVFEDSEARMQRGAAVMETLAHLELLHARGTAVRETREGVIHFGAFG